MQHSDFRQLVIAKIQDAFGPDVDIDDRQTIHKDYGWIVFYNTKAFLKSGDIMEGLMSNTPFLCTWQGECYPLPMHCSVEDAITLVEEELGLK